MCYMDCVASGHRSKNTNNSARRLQSIRKRHLDHRLRLALRWTGTAVRFGIADLIRAGHSCRATALTLSCRVSRDVVSEGADLLWSNGFCQTSRLNQTNSGLVTNHVGQWGSSYCCFTRCVGCRGRVPHDDSSWPRSLCWLGDEPSLSA